MEMLTLHVYSLAYMEIQ